MLEDRLALSPESGSIRTAGLWLQDAGGRFGMPDKSVTRLDLCLHEVLANILAHGGSNARSQSIVLLLRISRSELGGEARLEVSDAGEAFNPLSTKPPTGAQSLEAVEPGGLGLVMLRSNSDLLEYRREHDLNHLCITVRWKRGST